MFCKMFIFSYLYDYLDNRVQIMDNRISLVDICSCSLDISFHVYGRLIVLLLSELTNKKN